MSIYQLNQDVSFDLPLGWKISTDTDMDGVEHPTIFYDRYIDSSGKVAYKWSDFILTQDLEISSNNYLNDYVPKISRARYIVPGTPKCAFLVLNQSRRAILSGSTIFSVGLLVQVDDHSLLCFSFMNLNSLNGMHRRSVAYVNMCRVAQTVRIRGKALPLKGITPEFLQQELEADLNLDDDEFVRDAPDLYLYPHYHSRITPTPLAQNFSSMVVTNAGGCDYQFIPLKTLRDEADDDEQADLLEQILEQDDTADTSLSGKVRRMQPLFHVNRSAFDPSRDRESEIAEGYLESAYQFSALRSFAWTVAKYCKDEVLMPEEVDLETLHRLLKFISNHDWLNYSNDNFCQGLCGGSDLHVYYLPDCIDSDLQDQLLPSNEDREFAESMRTLFPNYNEIPNEVHSLDSLREDLEYIYPAVYRLWDELKQDRNPDQPLTGDAADIVYAWCVVANAASVPFFSEDGPSVCRFSYPNTRGISSADTAADSFTFGESRRSSTKPPISSKQKSVSRSTKTQSVKQESDWGNAVVIPKKDYRFEEPGVLKLYLGEDAEVMIPEGITEIGVAAFGSSDKLTKVIIPKTVAKIGDLAFMACKQLTRVIISEGVTKIGDLAFLGCEQLDDVVIPASVAEIGNSTFFDCKQLTNIVLPEGITKIGDSAFCGCEQLSDIVIPKSVIKIEDSAFEKCNDNLILHIPEGSAAIAYAEENNLQYDLILPPENCQQHAELSDAIPLPDEIQDVLIPESDYDSERPGVLGKYHGQDFAVIVPEGIVEIGKEAFSGCKQLVRVVLPESLTMIGENAFSGCEQLEDIVIPEGVAKIGKCAFSDCKQLTSIVIPEGVTQIENDTFSDCEKLEKVVIPKSVLKIQTGAFSGCEQLTDVEIPDRVTEIESFAFSECKHLKNIVLPASVTEIKDFAFSYCKQLKNIIIPESVTEIGKWAFCSCEQLTSIVIPDGITEIGDSTFSGCESLVSIVIPESVTVIDENSFFGCDNLKDVYLFF